MSTIINDIRDVVSSFWPYTICLILLWAESGTGKGNRFRRPVFLHCISEMIRSAVYAQFVYSFSFRVLYNTHSKKSSRLRWAKLFAASQSIFHM